MRCVPKENGIFIPYNLSFIKKAGSLAMAEYWPHFLFRVLMDFFCRVNKLVNAENIRRHVE